MADSLLLRGVNTILDHTGTEMVYMSNPRGGDTYAFPQWWNVNAAGAPNVQCTKFEVTNANGTCILLVDVSKSEGLTLKIVHDGSFGFTFPERLGTRRAALFTDAYVLIEAYEFQADPYAPVITTAGTGSKPAAKAIGTLSLTGVPATANGNVATGSLGFSESGGTADTAKYSYAWTGTGSVSFSASTSASTTATWPAATTGNQTVTLEITSSESGVASASVTSGNIALTATGGINAVNTFSTTTAFTASQSAAACTLSAPALGGTTAQATYDSDGSGNVTALNITTAGTTYTVGETVTITEDGGTPGVATCVIATLA